jgi:polyisoprenoid-binding protein YceI
MLKSAVVLPAAALSLAALAGWGVASSAPAVPAVAPTVAVAFAGAAAAEAKAFAVDTVHSSVLFRIRHAGVAPFYGRFDTFDGSFSFDPAAGISDLSFTIDINSVNTNNGKRDDHLRNADFFNARQFPDATFTQTSAASKSGEDWTLMGDLTLYGTTKPVEVTIREVRTGTFRNKEVVGFEAQFEIKRSEFGISTYLAEDGSDDGALGNTVRIIVGVEAGAQ